MTSDDPANASALDSRRSCTAVAAVAEREKRGGLPALLRVYVSDIDVWRAVKATTWIGPGAGTVLGRCGDCPDIVTATMLERSRLARTDLLLGSP